MKLEDHPPKSTQKYHQTTFFEIPSPLDMWQPPIPLSMSFLPSQITLKYLQNNCIFRSFVAHASPRKIVTIRQ